MTQELPVILSAPLKIAVIGAGNRSRTYMHYVKAHPEKVRLVAVIEPDDVRRNLLADEFGIPDEMRFSSCEDFFDKLRMIDAVVICTPDIYHYRQSMMALDAGYHVLLEKPIATTYAECLEIARKAEEKYLQVSICHVLRVHPLFRQIKKIIDSGKYGEIISISHIEEVGIDRDTHNYVRGTMNRENDNSPMLLAKCCHDLDFLLWISSAHCRRVSSFGSLRWFRKKNAPPGSSTRCINCDIEEKCPFSAVDLYKRRRDWIGNFIPAPGETVDDVIDRELKEGRFGRCVYHCDNDLVDNQVVTMQMDNGTIISLTINVFTQNDCRNISIKLTDGEITCDGERIQARHFRSRETSTYDMSYLRKIPHHGGADMAMIENFIDSLIDPDVKPVSPLSAAIESHLVIFEAERSRKLTRTIELI